MDEQKTGAVNGAKGSARQNDSEAKVNKTLLLRQQIEENRYLTLNKSEKLVNFTTLCQTGCECSKEKKRSPTARKI
jgi:hypothetical protein